MKNLIYLSLSLLLFFTACQKVDNNLLLEANKEMRKGPSAKVTICHKNGNGEMKSIEINQNALQAHLSHGDIIADKDGDGYTAIGSCTGSMDDCNDNDAAINPGAVEVCGDGVDNNCNGIIDENCGPDFKVFNIRNNGGTIVAPWDTDVQLNENAAGDGFSYSTPRAGQKVGYGTDFFDGQKLNSIQSVNWTLISGMYGLPMAWEIMQSFLPKTIMLEPISAHVLNGKFSSSVLQKLILTGYLTAVPEPEMEHNI